MNETPAPQDDQFLTEVKQVLDQSVQVLDPDKTNGLQRARMYALEQACVGGRGLHGHG
jgi:hypothetical protein